MGRIKCEHHIAVLSLCAAACLGSSHASAADGAANRHAPYLLSPARKPPGVPAEYVLTHNGFFHPSCVITVRSDEVTGADLVIRGLDGAEHARFAPCAYPSYSAAGQVGAPAHAPPVEPAAALYDGYIVSYGYWGSVPNAPTLTTDWVVPLPPKTVDDQDIAFFNDILTTADSGDILQPVLDFNGESTNRWAMESEHCCISGNDMQTTPVVVNVGDQIRGTVTGSHCAANGVCANWTVTTADLTTGKSTTLNTTAPAGVPNGVSPASLETYGVTSCDMFPASGTLTFAENQVTSSAGTATLKYELTILNGVNAEVPRTCGYAGMISGNDYTLVFGEIPEGGSGGTSSGGMSAGGAGGRAEGGASGASGGFGGTGGAGTSGNASGGTSGNGSAGSSAAAGASSTGGASGGAGSSSAGHAGVESSGAPNGGAGTATAGSAPASAGNADSSGASASSGCSCRVGASSVPASPAAGGLALLVAGLAFARRRPSRARRYLLSTRRSVLRSV
jgi:hypothetical protein